jgi:hypothetical protein
MKKADMVEFPPEADKDFGLVTQAKVEAWQEKLNERFGIGAGRLMPIAGVQECPA